MQLTLNISPEQEKVLQQALGPENTVAATEALLIGAYTTGRLSIGEVRSLLGLATRLEAENWLATRGVFRNYTSADLEQDRATLKHLQL